jgi:hypothetical protein
MRAVIETTQWADGCEYYNHVYLLDGDRCWAYIPHGTREIREFSTPRKIHRQGRRFQELSYNPFKTPAPDKSSVVTVAGSGGRTYQVDVQAKTCTCPGFLYRKQCRHVEQLTEDLP